MGYKWKPSKSQRREFAINMQNSEFKTQYLQRKEERAKKRRKTSQFDYNSAGGNYVPTKSQYDFCYENYNNLAQNEKNAANIVMSSYSLNEKCHHDFIHIINEKIRTCNI